MNGHLRKIIFLSTGLIAALSISAFAEQTTAPVVDLSSDLHAQQPNVNNQPRSMQAQPRQGMQQMQSQTQSQSQSQQWAQPAQPRAQQQPMQQQQPEPANLTPQQRIVWLERQLNNLTSMNLPQRINELQQQIEKLRGQLQEQSHQLQLLRTQKQKPNNTVQTAPPSSTPDLITNSSASKGDSRDTKTYKAAFELLTQKQYGPARNAFSDYLARFPQGHFRANAYYWLGELYLQARQFKIARTQFNRVVNEFPQSNKVPDAKLKLATILASRGQITAARRAYREIKRKYPDTTAAQLASIQLQQLDNQ